MLSSQCCIYRQYISHGFESHGVKVFTIFDNI